MGSPDRPISGLDILPKHVLIHPGLIFSGHLDIPRLQESAAKVIDVYPELSVSIKSDYFTLGKWCTPPATGPLPAWDFKHREWPDKTLEDVFAPAAAATGIDLQSSRRVTPLGAVEPIIVQDLFGFEGPPVGSIGRSMVPTLSFRVTILGGKENGHTLLNMIIPHLIMDAMGAGGLIETWGKLYSGETIPPRSPGNSHPDLIQLLDAVPASERGGEIKEDEQPGCGMRTGFLDFLSYARDLWRYTSKGCEEHYIHFPKLLLERFRDEARAKLQEEGEGEGEGEGQAGLSVSSHDVFLAMMLKMYAHSSLVSDDSLPFDFYCIYSLIPSFPKGALPNPYLHNINVPGWFPFPSTSAVSAASFPDLAVAIRKRLNALRTVNNVRETILQQEHQSSSLLLSPRVDARHGWGMVSSWRGVEDMASRGFSGEKLVFARPATQNPGELMAPNITFPIGDGQGGLFARVITIKGDWDIMWAKSGLADLE